MDIARPDIAQKKKRRRMVLGASAAVVVLGLSLGLSRLRPAAPTVDSTVWIDEVKRGPMVRQVRGLGTLVPEEIRWIAAATDGRVERLIVLPGTPVKADTVLLELSNPEVELAALDAVSQLRGAEASLAELKVRLESSRLNQEADLARIESEFRQARLKADTDDALAKQGLVADLTRQLSTVAAEEMAKREAVERKRLSIAGDAIRSQLAVKEAEVDAAGPGRAPPEPAHRAQCAGGLGGVLQLVPVEVGQQVEPGANLARVAEPSKLKAEVRIAETQAKDIQIGQPASIDTRNGIVPGHVAADRPGGAERHGHRRRGARGRAAEGRAARPQRRRHDRARAAGRTSLYVGRPAFGQERSTVGIFKLDRTTATPQRGAGRARPRAPSTRSRSSRARARRPRDPVGHVASGTRTTASASTEPCQNDKTHSAGAVSTQNPNPAQPRRTDESETNGQSLIKLDGVTRSS